MKVKLLSHVRLFATPWTVAFQAPPSMVFSRQEYWSGLPFPSAGGLPNPRIEPRSPIFLADALPSKPPGKPPKHILIKLTMTKHKERILKAAREKPQITYKGNPIHVTADLSAEILQARREWQDIFEVLKGENIQPRL